MKEIEEIMKKHEATGIVVLHRPGHVEYLNKIASPHTCAFWRYSSMGKEARFKAKADMYPGGAEDRNKIVAQTSNMLGSVMDVLSQIWLMWDELTKFFDKHVGPHEHTMGTWSSHEQQNN